MIRTAADPLALAGAARQAVSALDRDLAVHQVVTMDALIGERAGDRRYALLLLGSFVLLALLLAAIGLYGVMSYSVVQRTSEIGVRLALGAARGDILGMLLAQGMKPVALGVAAGVAGAAACMRFIRSLLYATSGSTSSPGNVPPSTRR